MKDFYHFEHRAGGAWECVIAAEIMTPMGRIQVAAGVRFTPGTKFMGVDVVQLLEQEAERRGRSNVIGSKSSQGKQRSPRKRN